MTFYQELQLNQEGSKTLIRSVSGRREKLHHTAIYMCKIAITMMFCMCFVMAYGQIFGQENSIVGVVILLFLMVFKNADFGIDRKDSQLVLALVFGIHSTVVLGYLLLYGYDVSGTTFTVRIGALAVGAALTMIVFYRGHKNRVYKRTIRDLFREIDLKSSRTRWQIALTLGIASVMAAAEILHLPRSMWAGIAVMSVMLPFENDSKKRSDARIPGNIIGGILFLLLYL